MRQQEQLDWATHVQPSISIDLLFCQFDPWIWKDDTLYEMPFLDKVKPVDVGQCNNRLCVMLSLDDFVASVEKGKYALCFVLIFRKF